MKGDARFAPGDEKSDSSLSSMMASIKNDLIFTLNLSQ
jgi:hypothetical protein